MFLSYYLGIIGHNFIKLLYKTGGDRPQFTDGDGEVKSLGLTFLI
jgi:hypothetical protein